MTEYDNTNKGALFGNTRKRAGKKDPDLQGKLDINGVEYWISAWFFVYEKDGEKKKGISLSLGDKVKPKGESKPKASSKQDDSDDDIPF